MKWYHLIWYLLPLLFSFNQHPLRFEFKSLSARWTVRDSDGKVIHEENRDVVGIPIIIDYDSALVETRGQAPLDIKLFAVMHKGKDENGNSYQTFAGIDKAKTKCVVVFTLLEHKLSTGGVATLDISYPRQDIVYVLSYK